MCLDLNCTNSRLAVGHRGGSFSCWKARADASGKVEDLVIEAKHSARKLDSSVIKFSPDGNFLAVGFHECVIDVYERPSQLNSPPLPGFLLPRVFNCSHAAMTPRSQLPCHPPAPPPP